MFTVVTQTEITGLFLATEAAIRRTLEEYAQYAAAPKSDCPHRSTVSVPTPLHRRISTTAKRVVAVPATAAKPGSTTDTAANAASGKVASASADTVANAAADTVANTATDTTSSADADEGAPSDRTDTFADVRVNGGKAVETMITMRDGDIAVPLSALGSAGLQHLTGKTETYQGQTFLWLRSLAPGVTYDFSQRTQDLNITASLSSLKSSTIDTAEASAPAAPADGNATHSTYLNYAAIDRRAAGPTLSSEIGSSIGAGLLTTQLLEDHAGLHRESTNFRVVQSGRRAAYGDTFFETSPLYGIGGAPALFGVSNLPDDATGVQSLLRNSGQTISGSVTSPSTVDVYVNGALVKQTTISPGMFTLTDLPSVAGANTAEVIVTDAFGRRQTLSRPYYLSGNVPAAGTTRWGMALGRSQNPTTQANQATAIVRFEHAVTKNVAVGSQVERAAAISAGGVYAGLDTPIGTADASFSSSRENGASGNAAEIGYALSRGGFNAGADMQYRSPAYANASLDATGDRPLRFSQFSLGKNVGTHVLTLTRNAQVYREQASSKSFSISDNFQIHGISISIGQQYIKNASSVIHGMLFNCALFSAAKLGATFSSASTTSGPAGSFAVSRAPDSHGGIGFQTTAQVFGSGAPVQSLIDADLPAGQAEVDMQSGIPSQYEFRGSLAFIGGGSYSSKPLTSSYGIVETGIASIPVSVNGAPAGVTGKDGRLFVADLLSDTPNEIRLATEKAPLNAQISSGTQTVSPAQGKGVKIRFTTHYVHAYSGTVTVRSKTGDAIDVTGGEIRLGSSDGAPNSIIGETGEFYFDNLPSGTYLATITSGTVSCSRDVTIPVSNVVLTDIGNVVCRMTATT